QYRRRYYHGPVRKPMRGSQGRQFACKLCVKEARSASGSYLAGGKQPRGRPVGWLCDNPQVQDAVGRADAILNAGRAYRTTMITELWNTVASGNETTLEQRARCRLAAVYAADCAREAMELMYRHGGS